MHALAHPDLGFALAIDGREIYRFAPGATVAERVRDLFGAEFAESMVPVDATTAGVRVHGFVERPDVHPEMRREQFIFTNGRPATAATIGYALREAYPRRNGENRAAVVLFIELDPAQVDVNVHPAKREVRFRRPADVREAVISAITGAFAGGGQAELPVQPQPPEPIRVESPVAAPPSPVPFQLPLPTKRPPREDDPPARNGEMPVHREDPPARHDDPAAHLDFAEIEVAPQPQAHAAPWKYFRFLAISEAGYVLIETDAGIVTLNPRAACERIVFERLLDRQQVVSQPLLIPETVQLSPGESNRLRSFLDVLEAQGFQIEEFGRDTWKIDAVPQVAGGTAATGLLATIAHDLAETGARRGGVRWRDELVAQSVARSFAGSLDRFTPEGAVKLVTELGACRSPYFSPRGKPVMIFSSFAELKRKFDR